MKGLGKWGCERVREVIGDGALEGGYCAKGILMREREGKRENEQKHVNFAKVEDRDKTRDYGKRRNGMASTSLIHCQLLVRLTHWVSNQNMEMLTADIRIFTVESRNNGSQGTNNFFLL